MHFRILISILPALFLGILPLTLHAAPPEKKAFEKTDESYYSDYRTTVVRVFREPGISWGAMQFRVFYEPGKDDDDQTRKTRSAKSGQILWEGENRANALISEDGEGIAINHHVLSDLGELLIFMRRPDGSYEKLNVDFQTDVLRLLIQQEKLPKPPDFDHIYCYADTWLTPHTILGHLNGHDSGASVLHPFWFIFDCSTRHFTFDLRSVNQGAYQTKEK